MKDGSGTSPDSFLRSRYSCEVNYTREHQEFHYSFEIGVFNTKAKRAAHFAAPGAMPSRSTTMTRPSFLPRDPMSCFGHGRASSTARCMRASSAKGLARLRECLFLRLLRGGLIRLQHSLDVLALIAVVHHPLHKRGLI